MTGIATAPARAMAWVEPLRLAAPELGALDLQRLQRFETVLGELLAAHPIDASVEPGVRSERLGQIRRELAHAGHLGTAVAARDGGCGRPAVVQTLMQFVCGYRDLLAIASNAAPGQSPPDLMLAAVHYLLAADLGDPLARYYPSLRFAPEASDPWPDFRRFCLERRDELVEVISSRRVQTNEVRRCTYLLPAVTLAGRLADQPLALIEPGASAGLNLALDAYAYDYGTGTRIGAPGSHLLLRCRLHGQRRPPLELPVPQLAWRAGVDVNPLDAADPRDAAWLRALVWADHRDRALRLDEALKVATSRPAVPMYAGEAVEQLPTAVAAAPPETAVCVMHTAFLAHFSQIERDRFTRQIIAASRRRTIYWIQAEPRRDPTEPRLRLAVCEAGRISAEWPLGHYQPHGAWLEWLTADVPAAA